MQYIQVNENDRLKRRIYFHLVDATDGITPETGEAGGTAKVSLNGATPTSSVNTLTTINQTDQPGTYYLELDPTEIRFPGIIIARYKSANTAEFVALGQIMAFDPYTQFGTLQGGGADVDYKRIKKMIDEAVNSIPKVEMMEHEKFDYETLAKGFESVINETRSIHIPTADFAPVLSQLKAIEKAVAAIEIPETNLDPIMERIDVAISITEDLLDETKEETGKTAEQVKEFLIKDTEAIKKSIGEVSTKLDDIQYVVIDKTKKEQPKKSVLDEYLNLK